MDKQLDNAALLIQKRLPTVEGVYCYGSYLTPFFQEDSDVDLAILARELDEFAGESFETLTLHEYTKVNLDIVASVVRERLDDLLSFSGILLKN